MQVTIDLPDAFCAELASRVNEYNIREIDPLYDNWDIGGHPFGNPPEYLTVEGEIQKLILKSWPNGKIDLD